MITQTSDNAPKRTLTDAVKRKLDTLTPSQQQAVSEFIDTLQESHQITQSIWDKIESRIAEIPPEVIAELPPDASENLDHYLYGVPKK